MTDYTKFSDDEIRKAVAKIAGYRVIYYDDLYFLLEPHKTIEQVTRALQMNFYAAAGYTTEDKAWELSSAYPKYLNNLHTCWLLFSAFDLPWTVSTIVVDYAKYRCSVGRPHQEPKYYNAGVYEAYAATPMRAMCDAFLKWSEGEHNEIQITTPKL